MHNYLTQPYIWYVIEQTPQVPALSGDMQSQYWKITIMLPPPPPQGWSAGDAEDSVCLYSYDHFLNLFLFDSCKGYVRGVWFLMVTYLESSMMFNLSESSCDPNGCIARTMKMLQFMSYHRYYIHVFMLILKWFFYNWYVWVTVDLIKILLAVWIFLCQMVIK